MKDTGLAERESQVQEHGNREESFRTKRLDKQYLILQRKLAKITTEFLKTSKDNDNFLLLHFATEKSFVTLARPQPDLVKGFGVQPLSLSTFCV